MVEHGFICARPRFERSETSGYRILEHTYAELSRKLLEDIRRMPLVLDQRYTESFHDAWVSTLAPEEWDSLLNLKPIGTDKEK